FDINAAITQLLSPISSFVSGNNIFGVYVLATLITLFWSAGLHGVSLVGAVARPFWEIAITENMDAFALGAVIPNLYTEQFLQWFVWIGGSGATIGLVILMTFFAKSQYLKQLGRVSFVPSLFNINEPIIFGAPIVMNPVLIIPFVVAPLVMITTAALAMNLGLVGPMGARAPWTLPGPRGAAMSVESGNFFAFILCIINILISLAIYFPFFKAYDKQMVAQETSGVE
ncbi:MAG: PTS transporter subunit EIIC, partial [Culicoidibacterales bacterium]